MIKKYNISKPKVYTKDGQEKTLWQNIGTMTEFIKDNGQISRKIEIPAIGLDAQLFPFDDKKETPKDTRQVSNGYMKKEMTPEEEYNAMTPNKEVDEDVVNPEDIPY